MRHTLRARGWAALGLLRLRRRTGRYLPLALLHGPHGLCHGALFHHRVIHAGLPRYAPPSVAPAPIRAFIGFCAFCMLAWSAAPW